MSPFESPTLHVSFTKDASIDVEYSMSSKVLYPCQGSSYTRCSKHTVMTTNHEQRRLQGWSEWHPLAVRRLPLSLQLLCICNSTLLTACRETLKRVHHAVIIFHTCVHASRRFTHAADARDSPRWTSATKKAVEGRPRSNYTTKKAPVHTALKLLVEQYDL